MKPNPIATRALAGMLPAMALFATPALAQDAAQPAPPTIPPVVQPAPPVAQPAPPVAAQPAPATTSGPSAEDRAKLEASATAATGTATAPAEAAPPPAARRAPARPAPRAAARTAAPAAAVSAPAPTAPSPATVPPAESPAPAATALPDAPMTTPIPEPGVATDATATDATTTTETTSSVPTWAWIAGALALLAILAAVFGLRRRREEPVWQDDTVATEPVYAEPVATPAAVAAPAVVAAAPLADDVVAEDRVEVVAPAADEVAAITAASAPVTGRPWIELSLRPLRAGTTEDSAMVDLELTLANAGEVAARDVRVSTFMLGDGSDAPTGMDQLLAAGQGGTQVNAGDLGAGEGSRVDASLTVPREGLDGATFQPIVVADVRYTLPDGGEGRTAAAFAVGVDDGTDDPTPLRLGGDIREDVSATLHGVPERA